MGIHGVFHGDYPLLIILQKGTTWRFSGILTIFTNKNGD